MQLFRFKNSSLTALVCLSVTVSACGKMPLADSSTESSPGDNKGEIPQGETGSGVAFTGSVVSAFEVVVDGAPYRDMEDFYTAEAGRLAKKISDAGYAGASNVRFDAELGFLDLWRQMTVFVIAEGTEGYMSNGLVSNNGSFSVSLPEDAAGDSYKVRANKRIKVLFTYENMAKTFCYNFSAVQQNVSLAARAKPILLSRFESSLTAYDCPESTEASELQVPKFKTSSQASSETIQPGMSKAQVSVALGVSGLTILDANNWCYSPESNDAICEVAYQNTSCRCSLLFDSKGLLSQQSNISPERLKDGAWK